MNKIKHQVICGIEHKKCSTCKTWKFLDMFGIHRMNWDGFQRECKKCRLERYNNTRNAVLKKQKEYAKKNKERIRLYKAEHYRKNKDHYAEKAKQYLKDNRDFINKNHRKYYGHKYKTDINFRLVSSIRSRIFRAMKNNIKSGGTLELIGCSISKYKTHLENQFTDSMTWDNHGSYWHIDHIIPCSHFDLSKKDQQLKCFHYSNVQPLTVIENMAKGNRILK